MSKTIAGAVVFLLAHIFGPDFVDGNTEAFIVKLIELIGGIIAAYGIWHGQKKVKETVALNSPQQPGTIVK